LSKDTNLLFLPVRAAAPSVVISQTLSSEIKFN